VRPEALLQIPPPKMLTAGDSVNISLGTAPLFTVADRTPVQTIFAAATPASNEAPGRLQAIVERTLTDDEAAVAALLSADVDVLDRVPPWQIERLRAAPGIRVQHYQLPTVHVLIPNFDRPLLARREFRRALCFGIDRQWIVDRVLLAGGKFAGFEVLSGPFPTGLSLSDPLRYGYNSQLRPRPFEPRLAAILATVAWSGVQTAAAKEKDKAAPAGTTTGGETREENDQKSTPTDDPPLADIPELVLAHPANAIARIACQSIQLQLTRVGIPVSLREFSADQLAAGKVDYDLRYAELAVWEPVTDARLLFGPKGLAGGLDSPYLHAALRRLDEASNWKEVRTRLAEVHEIAHHELPLIPLWQTVNYFAYHESMNGIAEEPILLYQDVGNWSRSLGGNVAQLKSTP
jgi:ABC-type transport system substrate-binding protein